jgi:2-oxoacid:acceptor oxidoreductase gamma subunit (pyruvate/2-ketoisovalerate family)
MFEIRFHGRGGQGTVLAAKIIADAVLLSGKAECMAFPEFGVERRGAPVVAYARIDDKPIVIRSRIYEPDAVVLLDPTLAAGDALLKGLKPGGSVLINTDHGPEDIAGNFSGLKVYCLPARRIALEQKLGSPASPMVNTAICGAVCALFDLADPASLEQAIRAAVPAKADANVAAARMGAERVLGGIPCPR